MSTLEERGRGPSQVELRTEIIRTCRRMAELGINQGTSGNVSVRFGERFLVTPSGIPYDEMEPEAIAEMAYDGSYFGPFKPTTEWRFHREILLRRPDVNAVIHTHSMFATTVACLRKDIPAVHYYVAVAGGPTVRCAPYATYGTQQLAENAVRALEGRKACLLANHGMIVLGDTLNETLRRTVDVETLATQFVRALQTGEPVIPDDAEIYRVVDKIKTYGTQTLDDPDLRALERPFSA
jgi:L-fuculose-phosphate aldolase